MRFIYLIGLLFCIPIFGYNQSLQDDPIFQLETWLALPTYSGARAKLDSIAHQFASQGDTRRLIRIHETQFWLSLAYDNQDRMRETLASLHAFEELKENPDFLLHHRLIYQLFDVFLEKEEQEARRLIKALERLFPQIRDQFPLTEMFIPFFQTMLVEQYEGGFTASVPGHRKTLEMLIQLGQKETWLTCAVLSKLCHHCRKQAEFEEGIGYYEQMIRIYDTFQPKDHPFNAKARYNLATFYYHLGETDLALKHYLSVEPSWKKYPPQRTSYSRYLYESIGDLYWERNEEERALHYWNQASNYNGLNLDLSDSSTAKADTLEQEGKWEEAMEYYQEALSFRIKEYGADHPMTGACNTYIARAFAKQDKIEEGLARYHQSIQMFLPQYASADIRDVPSPDSFQIHNIYFVETIFEKASLWYRKWQRDHSMLDLETAYQTAFASTRFIERLRKEPLADRSIQYWSSKAIPIFEILILSASDLFKETGKKKYLETAFLASERSKSFLLLSAIQEQSARVVSALPAELVEQERMLRQEILAYQARIEKEEKRCQQASTNRLSVWKDKLLEIQVAYEQLMYRLEIEYPDYYQLKYQINVQSTNKIQYELVQSQRILIEFFEGEQYVFGFCLQGDSISMIQVLHDEGYTHAIEQFKHSISDRTLVEGDPASAYQAFIRASHGLYQRFLSPFEAQLKESDDLLIVPDGLLSYCPLELLITQLPDLQGQRNYKTLSYLLKRKQVAYASSMSILLNKRAKSQSQVPAFEALFMAPDYVSNEDLPPLHYNQQEVQMAQALLSGHCYVGKDATKSVFKRYAPQAQMLHLAMHTIVDDQNPVLSKLVFSSEVDFMQDDHILYAYELYGMSLKAELVLLSACNTGVGQWKRGEGMMSLARAFQYIGCPSVVASLWNIDDIASANLLHTFYTELIQKKKKHEALRLAKLQYLDQADPLTSHPYFWAGFILIGETTPLETSSLKRSSWKVIGMGIGLMLIGFWIYQQF